MSGEADMQQGDGGRKHKARNSGSNVSSECPSRRRGRASVTREAGARRSQECQLNLWVDECHRLVAARACSG